MRIVVVAPSKRLDAEVAEAVRQFAARLHGESALEIVFHPQCFLSDGHFAGPDKAREDALVEVANDPSVDAVWFARGGYGANRIAEAAIGRMGPDVRDKPFVGYSDTGFILAGLLAKDIGRPVHGPMPIDIRREGGAEAVARTLDWLLGFCPAEIPVGRYAAFNMIVFSQLLGTPLQPDLTGRVLMLEEVDEPMYRIDRAMFHITSNPGVRNCAGIMLGRCAPIMPNDPDFGMDEVAVAEHWCRLSGIPYLGRADIGHDSGNKLVPFG